MFVRPVRHFAGCAFVGARRPDAGPRPLFVWNCAINNKLPAFWHVRRSFLDRGSVSSQSAYYFSGQNAHSVSVTSHGTVFYEGITYADSDEDGAETKDDHSCEMEDGLERGA